MTDRRELSPGIQALVDLGLKAVADEKARTLKGLGAWFDRRETLRPQCTQEEAIRAIGDLLGQVRDLCEPLMGTAFGGQDSAGIDMLKSIRTPAEQVRVERLDLLARKLLVAARFFDRGSSASSMREAAAEVRAIHAGDDPRLFAQVKEKRRKGRPRNAYRIAENQLRALEWDRALDGRGMPPGERHTLIQSAYVFQWDSMRSNWREACDRELGLDRVAQLLEMAHEDGANRRPVFGEKYGIEFADALAFDAKLYREEREKGNQKR
jgi:hypothetical protein